MTHESTDFPIESVIASIRRGERDKFRLILREYGLLVRGYLAARLHHQEDVEDLAQEVFLVAFERLESYQGGPFGAWLVGIARNRLRNHWRAGRRRADAMDRFREEMGEVIEPELDEITREYSPAQIDRLLHCISLLPDRLRRIVRAGLDGTRASALVEELGMNANAIYQARFRAHGMLRRCMKQPGNVPID